MEQSRIKVGIAKKCSTLAFLRSDGYWYQTRREGDRVISKYLGKGPFIEALVAMEKLEHEQELMCRYAERKEMEVDRKVDRQIDAVVDVVRMLTAAEMLVNGFYTHKGQWCRKGN